MNEKYTVIIADDHPGVRSGIAGILEGCGDFKVVAEVGDGPSALQVVKQQEPDLLVLDVKLPEIEGPEVAKALTASGVPTTILALSSYDLPDFVLSMIENGARGYLTKEQAPQWLPSAARELLGGKQELWISETLRHKSGLDLE